MSIIFRSLVFLLPISYYYCLFNLLDLSVPDKGYYRKVSCVLNLISTFVVLRGGFRGGRAGHAPPLKFAKHMLYNVNQIVQQATFSWMVNSWPVVKYSYTWCIDNFRFCLSINKNGRIIRLQWMNQTTKRKAPSGRAVLTRTIRKDKHRNYRPISEMRNALKLNQ